MRILGLDFGDKTIGVAVSDPFGWTAQGVEIIRRENPNLRNVCVDWQNWWNNTRQRQSFWAIRKIWTAPKGTDVSKQRISANA